MKLIERSPFKRVEKYMDKHYGKRYNDEFTIIDGELAGVFKGHSTFVLKSKRFPDFYTRVSKYSEFQYYTNYIQCLYADEYRDYMQSLIETIIPVCKVVYMVNFYPVFYSKTCTFDEFLHDGNSLKHINIIVPSLEYNFNDSVEANLKDPRNADINKKMEEIISMLEEKNIPIGEIAFTQIPDFADSKGLNSLNEWSDYYDENRKELKTVIFHVKRDFKIRGILEGL